MHRTYRERQRNALSASAKVILNPKYRSKLGIERANIRQLL